MAKRKPREEPLGPAVTLSNHRFGWCVDNIHDGCSKSFTYYEKTYVCSCKCHEAKSE